MKNPIKVVTHKRVDDKGLVTCEECGEKTTYTNKFVFMQHITKFHGFSTKDYYDKFYKGPNEGICKICGKETHFVKFSNGYRIYCSAKCTQQDEKVREAVENISEETRKLAQEKQKQTNLEKYGKAHYFQTGEFRERMEEMVEKDPDFHKRAHEKRIQFYRREYGVDNQFQSEVIKQRIRNTNLVRYGADNIAKTPEGRERLSNLSKKNVKVRMVKLRETMNKKFENKIREIPGYSLISQKWVDKGERGNVYPFRELVLKCPKGHEFDIQSQMLKRRERDEQEICNICNPYGSSSELETGVIDFIKSIYSGTVLVNNRSLFNGRLELDIYLPELKIGFEANGTYWHSTQFVDKFDHANKRDIFAGKGIKVYQIYEDDWTERRPMVESMIKGHLGIFEHTIDAEDTFVTKVLEEKAIKFIRNDDLNGLIDVKMEYLGLFYDGKLVQLIGYDDSFKIHKRVTLGGYNVRGGFRKLMDELKYRNRLNFVDVVANLDTDDLGELGGELVDSIPPAFFLVQIGKPIAGSATRFTEELDTVEDDEDKEPGSVFKVYNSGKAIFRLG